MKKYHSLLFLLALIGLAIACSKNDTLDGQNSKNNRVVFSARIGDGLQLRSGAQTRASGNLQLPGYALRYILEVWNESDAVAHREEKLVTDAAQTVVFEFGLEEAGDYNALLWADYIPAGAAATNGHYPDLYYKTDAATGLKAISIIGTAYAVNTPSRDAFFGNSSFTKDGVSETDAGNVTLTRPFGRINIIENSATLLAELTNLELAYTVPSDFNAADGSVSGTYNVALNGITSFPQAATEKANLFYDYILAPAIGQHLLGELQINYTLESAITETVHAAFTIPSNMPVERNKRTNISGSILNNPELTSLSVAISDAWTEPDTDEEIDPNAWDGVSTSEPAGYTAGSPGTVDITSATELAWLATKIVEETNFSGYTFNLTTDINLNNKEWIVSTTKSFTATFDGQGHTVHNLRSTGFRGGLFGTLTSPATVKNVTVDGNITYTGDAICYLGGIAGSLSYATIENCTNHCTITGESTATCNAGGIAGYVSNGSTFTNNTNTGAITAGGTGTAYTGGIIGHVILQGATATVLTGNTHSGSAPTGVIIGICYPGTGTITIDGVNATPGQPFPVPAGR